MMSHKVPGTQNITPSQMPSSAVTSLVTSRDPAHKNSGPNQYNSGRAMLEILQPVVQVHRGTESPKGERRDRPDQGATTEHTGSI
jgi:hypothetical protein